MQFSFGNVSRLLFAPASAFIFLIWVNFLIISGSLPDPVAIHWGMTGQADGFIARSSYLLVVGPAIVIPLALKILFYFLLRKLTLIRKFIGAILSFTYWMLFVIMLSATATQIGSSNAEQSNFPIVLIAFLLLLIPFTIWFALAFPEIDLINALAIRMRGIKVLSVPFSEIRGVETAHMSPWNFGGVGIRVSGKTLAFIPSQGEGVVFSLNSGEKIAVRSKQASEVASSVLSRLGG